MANQNSNIGFRRFGIFTIAAIYLLIMVGGIVRSTGSGMGCPDWPKCFGQWVPPTQESQLPENYKEIYASKRKNKNLKLAHYLDALGLPELSYAVAHDPAIYNEPTFNPVKTWIEYVNRLLGVSIGILIVATLVYSFRFRQTDPTIMWLSAAAVLITVFQAWLGSIVVSTNLLPFMITLHMVLAIMIVALLIYVIARSQKETIVSDIPQNVSLIQRLIYAVMTLSLAQIVLGTQVREGVDVIRAAVEQIPQTLIVDRIGLVFYIHRSFSILVLLANAYLWYNLRRAAMQNSLLLKLQNSLMLIILAAVVTGIVMAYFNVPAFAQPLHLTLSAIMIGLQLLMAVLLRFYQQKEVAHTMQTTAQH